MLQPAYLLPVWDTIEVAWSKMKRSKGPIWVAVIASTVILLSCEFTILIISFISTGIHNQILMIIVNIISILLFTGLINIGMRHAFGLSIPIDVLFQPFNPGTAFKIIILNLIEFLLFFIPHFMIILSFKIFMNLPVIISLLLSIFLFLSVALAAGICLFLFYRLCLAVGFILDKNQGPWEAIVSSFTVTRHNVLRLFAIHWIAILIFFISIIPLGIGLIWTVPFIFNLYGIVYKRLFMNTSSFDKSAVGLQKTN